MRQRQLKRLHELKTRDRLLLKLGAARQHSPSASRFVEITIPKEDTPFRFSLRKDKLRKAGRREGRYLLRTNLVGRDPADMWEFYTQLVHVLRSPRHLTQPSVQFGARPHPSIRHREVQHRSDDRCPSPHNGRPHRDHVPAYPARARTSDSAEPTATLFPRSASASHGGKRRPGRTWCSEDLLGSSPEFTKTCDCHNPRIREVGLVPCNSYSFG